ncbi:MAG: TerC family protein [Pigmentiphaga sp.]|uniref:TerC family protein n=1 Tax=Pigmentiphaga sp. TaxID=1977564 RepID=UPI0029A7A4C1|nr:TerC family protein [Pigmentiphaga sp.]MDX3905451.1 TerC family protein [Pigmentiphaga sp.]
MDWLMDPTAWAGLLTLIVLEIVLGVDNLVFIAILAEKLPPNQRDKARIIGLSLALVMRLALLSAISWLSTLTRPLFDVAGFSFSGRDLILLIGGLFLLFKATLELHERLEGAEHSHADKKVHAGFWLVIMQIVLLDAVFSLDSVITAVGMVDDLSLMMTAVVIAVAVMLFASKPLTRFVGQHPTVVVLCLSFLLMIGLSLVADGFGFHIPKGYLYAAIGFSIMIEMFNQVARRNAIKHAAHRPMRARTADAILTMLGGRRAASGDGGTGHDSPQPPAPPTFAAQERNMVSGVLKLADRSVRSIMTPRSEVSWVDMTASPEVVRQQILETPHSYFPVCRQHFDDVAGSARAKDLLRMLTDNGRIDVASLRPPIYVHESIGTLELIEVLRRARGQLVFVTDEYGTVLGVVTPIDVLEAIAGEFPDEDETPTIQPAGDGRWLIDGTADVHHVEQVLGVSLAAGEDDGDYSSLAGFLLTRFAELPTPGKTLDYRGYRFTVQGVTDNRISTVEVRHLATAGETSIPDGGS